ADSRELHVATGAETTRAAGRTRATLALASALATTPVWMVTFPPMVDLPQHAAQVALLSEVGNPDFPLGSLFELNWFTPYLLGYLLIHALTLLIGLVPAVKTVVALALAALPLTTALLLRETGADTRWALLVIPTLYGFTYQWGLLNFLVAAPVGLVFLAIAIRHSRHPTRRTALALGLLL